MFLAGAQQRKRPLQKTQPLTMSVLLYEQGFQQCLLPNYREKVEEKGCRGTENYAMGEENAKRRKV